MRPLTLARLLPISVLSGLFGAQAAASALTVGHTGNPLLAPLYAAVDQAKDDGPAVSLRRFNTGGDVGYALLAGEIDAGFVEPSKALSLLRLPGAARLRASGVVTFPYGATLVLRKDLDRRLDDLGDARIAAVGPHCALLHQFWSDAARLGADLSRYRLRYMPFDAMLPALESRSVDAIMVKGAYAVLALQQGHAILYQNWNVQAGDACCPAIVSQAEYVFIVRSDAGSGALLDALVAANKLPPSALRLSTARHVAWKADGLNELPLASFSILTPALSAELGLSAEETTL